MDALFGTSNPALIVFVKLLWCGAAIKTGHVIADSWRPVWHNLMYGALLGVADRLLGFMLLRSELLSVTGYLLDAAVLIALALVAYRATQAHKMASQYPWLYERTGPFGWRERMH